LSQFQRDDVPGLAAQVAYYLILSLFPLLLVIFSLLGTFSSPELAQDVLGYFQRVLPEQVYGVIETYVGNTLSGDRQAPGVLSIGIIATLWAASGALSAFIKALNSAYDVEETRAFWKVKGLAIILTLGLSVLVVVGVVLLVLGPVIGEALAGRLGLGSLFDLVWNIGRWVIALLFLVSTVALLYYFAPDARLPFRWITPGGIVAVVLWVLASVAFSFYISNFGSYDETYGSIGAAIILLIYLYISSLMILLGAELNSVLVRTREENTEKEILEGRRKGG